MLVEGKLCEVFKIKFDDSLLGAVTKAPRSYDELYHNWRPLALKLTHAWLSDFPFHERVDIADTLISEFCALDYLNPAVDHGFDWHFYDAKDGIRCVRFSTFFITFCTNRLKNVRYHTYKSFSHVPIMESEEEGCHCDPPSRDTKDMTEFIDTVKKVKEALDRLSPGGNKNLSELFVFIVKSVFSCGSVSSKDIARRFRVTRRTANAWLSDLSYCKALDDLF